MAWITRAEMKDLLARWPVKGKVVEVTVTYDDTIPGEVPMDIDEYGNYWVSNECVTEPPNLPLSWRQFRLNMRDLMRQVGLDPDVLEKYERLYVDPEALKYGYPRHFPTDG